MRIRQRVEYAERVREGPDTAGRRRQTLEGDGAAIKAKIGELSETAAALDRRSRVPGDGETE